MESDSTEVPLTRETPPSQSRRFSKQPARQAVIQQLGGGTHSVSNITFHKTSNYASQMQVKNLYKKHYEKKKKKECAHLKRSG